MANITDLRVIKTKKLIKETFFELLDEEDFDKVNVKQICEKSMIGRSTFYQHFDDKYDLLEQQVNNYASKFAEILKQYPNGFSDDHALENIVAGLQKDAHEILTLLQLQNKSSNLSQEFEKQIMASIQNVLNTNPMSNLPTKFVSKVYADNIMLFITWSLKNGIDQNINSFVNKSIKQEYDLWLRY